jgi:hypothetical protein
MIHCDECGGFFETEESFREHFHATHLRQA